MGFESYINENEAAILAGVSIPTLRRFAEAGYFKIETETDGLKLYSRNDLDRIFGLKQRPSPIGTPVKRWESLASASKNLQGSSLTEAPATEALATETSTGESPAAVTEPESKLEIASTAQSETPSKLMDASPATATKTAPNLETPVQSAAMSTPPAQQSVAIDALERELAKLRLVNEMHEKFVEIRENEIKTLSEEREWLRARIEKLEEKSSRDQILLLSETQTIKTLISMSQTQRSPVRAALEWLGIVSAAPVEPQRTIGNAIEVNDDQPNKAPATTDAKLSKAKKAA